MREKNYNKNLRVILIFFFVFNIFTPLLAQSPQTFATFHCVSLYWKPTEGAADNECILKFRAEGETTWTKGMSLWYDPNSHEGLPERSQEYRGSIVDLVPGTNYEIKLELVKTGTTVSLFQRTLSESFPVKSTVILPPGESGEPLVINNGGSETDGYVLYTSAEEGSIINVNKQSDFCIQVNASYVIIRGLILKGASKHGIILSDVNNVIIEECDISGWGSVVQSGTYAGFGINIQSAVYSYSEVISNTIIQRNKLHHPSTTANSWEQPVPQTHPQGPQAISFMRSKGFHIIRYNEIFSDKDHMFNDGMGATQNSSFRGFPNRDSDIYCNLVTHCWDDAIEAEGAGMNVRIWGNYLDTTYVALGLAPQSLGPQYVFRNVANFSQRAPYPIEKYNRGGLLFKIGGEADNYRFAKGKLVLMHNTSLQPPTPWSTGSATAGVENGLNYTSPTKVQDNIVTRNNIIQVRDGKGSIGDGTRNPTNSFDYDLYNGSINAIAGSQVNGIRGIPVYDPSNKIWEYYLSPSTAGHQDGLAIPNINIPFVGKAPDRGAFERGLPPLKYGINADWNIWVNAKNGLINTYIKNNHDRDEPVSMFTLFPNPLEDVLTIQSSGYQGFLIITVYNNTGKTLISETRSFESVLETSLDIGKLASGTYLVRLTGSMGFKHFLAVKN